MLPATSDRVAVNTSAEINARLQRETAERVRRLAGNPVGIDARLRHLDEEWDIERALEANAAALALTGVVLSVTNDRRWMVLPGVVTAFLLQHALQGWCPPVPVLRRMGFRTPREIEVERNALKAMRGDFAAKAGSGGVGADRALEAARL
jgi:hypothetical protein